MTNSTSNLVVAKRLWHGGRFYENGTAFVDLDPAPTSGEQALYEDGGFLMDADELEKQRDAKAYELKQAARANASEVERLTRELEDLREQGGVDVAPLTALFPDAPDFAAVVEEVKTLQARAKTLEVLHAPQGGKDLPQNFVGRSKLAAFGLTTFESLRGKTAAQLDAIEGLTAEHAGKIVEAVEKYFSAPAE